MSRELNKKGCDDHAATFHPSIRLQTTHGLIWQERANQVKGHCLFFFFQKSHLSSTPEDIDLNITENLCQCQVMVVMINT